MIRRGAVASRFAAALAEAGVPGGLAPAGPATPAAGRSRHLAGHARPGGRPSPAERIGDIALHGAALPAARRVESLREEVTFRAK